MTVVQDTLEVGVMPNAEEVEERAWSRASAEGQMPWTRRHFEILREEWLAAYPDCDQRSRDELDESIRRRDV